MVKPTDEVIRDYVAPALKARGWSRRNRWFWIFNERGDAASMYFQGGQLSSYFFVENYVSRADALARQIEEEGGRADLHFFRTASWRVRLRVRREDAWVLRYPARASFGSVQNGNDTFSPAARLGGQHMGEVLVDYIVERAADLERYLDPAVMDSLPTPHHHADIDALRRQPHLSGGQRPYWGGALAPPGEQQRPDQAGRSTAAAHQAASTAVQRRKPPPGHHRARRGAAVEMSGSFGNLACSATLRL